MLALIQRFHVWCCRYERYLVALTLLLLLRLPNFSEPYWYGDEAIYLTIGTALRNGARLYTDIVDHKTPLIYYLAMTPTQVEFRLLLLAFMSVMTIAFTWLVQRLIPNRWLSMASAFALVVFTSMPWLEGNIPNGELFVMAFIVISLWLLVARIAYGIRGRMGSVLIFAAGIFAGLGVLTKVPALLDVFALGMFLWFVPGKQVKRPTVKTLVTFLIRGVIFSAGVFAPILLSVLYFWMRGSLADYLQFGLLYNLHYTQSWIPELPFSWMRPMLLLPVKAGILGVFSLFSLALAWLYPKTRVFAFSFLWFWATVFAALLSNRPYPHYVMQTVLPLILMVSSWVALRKMVLPTATLGITVLLFVGTIWSIGFSAYPSWEYYSKAFSFATGYYPRTLEMALGIKSPSTYRWSFNGLVAQNETLLPYIQEYTMPKERIFIWGTNPMLYAFAQRSPATRFTVAFHIHDLKAYESTLTEITKIEPRVIVVMKKESELPGLKKYLSSYYIMVTETPDMVLYRRTTRGQLPIESVVATIP